MPVRRPVFQSARARDRPCKAVCDKPQALMAAIKPPKTAYQGICPQVPWAYANTKWKGKKVDNMEKKLKREDIDRIITESFINAGGCDIDAQFLGNMKKLDAELKEDGMKDGSIATMFLSCIMTAQANAINTMRGVLYRLFCGEEETKTGNGDSKQYRYRGNEDVFNK